MDYSKKLSVQRFRDTTVPDRDFNEEMESDRGRAINSAAVRRLQQKTQVFPLEINAAVRSRLTHSMEVQQVGRYLAKNILKSLSNQIDLNEIGLAGNEEGFVSAVEIACLLHDIGNPPFGHFGEKAIDLWVSEDVKSAYEQRFSDYAAHNPDIERFYLDLECFEGNAQGIRILHSLQGLNLSFSQLASVMKYTRPAYERRPDKGSEYEYRKKKPGYYLSEQDLINKVVSGVGLSDGCRFPLTYIMEAADDISYCIADLEDAVDKKLLDIAGLVKAVKDAWMECVAGEGLKGDDAQYLLSVISEAEAKMDEADFNKSHAFVLHFKTKLVNDLVRRASAKYLDRHVDIFHGRLDSALLDLDPVAKAVTESLKAVAVRFVFSAREVENLELKGYSIICGLLKLYSPLIRLSFYEFKDVVEGKGRSFPIESRLYNNLSGKHRGAYRVAVSDVLNSKDPDIIGEAKEFYYRVRLIIDYVSGMTDQFAMKEYQALTAAI